MTFLAVTNIASRRRKPRAKPKSAPRETDAEWWDRMGREYPHVNAAVEYDRARQWAKAHKRECSRPFLANWWKRAEEQNTPVAPPPAAPKPAKQLPQVNSTTAALLALQGEGRKR